MTINDLRIRDELLAQIAPGVDLVIPDAVKGHPLATSASVLSHLVTSLESLKNGHLDLAESANAYGANVLLRVFLEHTLKAIAIFLDSTKQNAALADGYLRVAETEAKAYLKALSDAGIEESKVADSPLAPLFTKGKALTNSDKEKIDAPFKYKMLIETIKADLGPGSESFLLKIIPNYAELSGFVHGGPSTSLILRVIPAGALEEILVRDASLVVEMFYSVKRYLLSLAAAMEPGFQLALDELENALDVGGI